MVSSWTLLKPFSRAAGKEEGVFGEVWRAHNTLGEAPAPGLGAVDTLAESAQGREGLSSREIALLATRNIIASEPDACNLLLGFQKVSFS